MQRERESCQGVANLRGVAFPQNVVKRSTRKRRGTAAAAAVVTGVVVDATTTSATVAATAAAQGLLRGRRLVRITRPMATGHRGADGVLRSASRAAGQHCAGEQSTHVCANGVC